MYTTYSGELVQLRPFKDAQEYSRMFMDTNLFDEGFWGHAWSARQSLKERFEEDGCLSTGMSRFAIDRLDTGELAGFEYCFAGRPGSLVGSMGTEISIGHRANGFGREAKRLAMCFLFENFPIECIQSNTHFRHNRAKAGLEACNLSYEGTKFGTWFTSGEQADVVCYSILREDWEAMDYRHKVKRGA